MSKNKNNALERLNKMKQEKEAAAINAQASQKTELVSQLTHETDGTPDFSEVAKRLAERKEKEAKGENEGHVKMTIYVRKDIADAFTALITKRGQQKEFTNQALADFIQKKTKELGL